MMTDVGHTALLLALVFSVYTALVGPLAGSRRRDDLLASARHSAVATFALASLATAMLIVLLLSRDYQVRYVYQHVNASLQPIYALAALWAGQEGSLLLWLWLVALLGGVMAWRAQRAAWSRDLEPYALAVMGLMTGFLALLLAFVSRPFDLLPARALDGVGLNPLLENPGMIYHPPVLFLGYAAYTVPFAYAIAALMAKRLDADWVRGVRRWALLAWGALGLGILLGAQWAYVELGWGGYWAWDPVENASLIPWLTGTALLHSLMIQERRGLFKVWNQSLIAGTFAFCLFATFITRSGMVQSVHAFGGSPIGYYFLALIALVLLGTLGLAVARRSLLQSHVEMEDALSREGAFLLTNLLFTGLAVAVLLGTVFPALTGLLMGAPLALGQAFFDRVSEPLALALIFLLGVCPLLGWRHAGNLRSGLIAPAGAVVIGVGALVLGLNMHQPLALVAFGLIAWAGGTIAQEFVRGAAARRQVTGEAFWKAPLNLVIRNRRRYGGYLVHLAILLIALGVTGAGLYKVERQVTLRRGEGANVGPYQVRFEGLVSEIAQDKERHIATVGVYVGNTRIGTLRPEYNYYVNVRQFASEVAIRSTLREDLYVAVAAIAQDGSSVTFRVLINPLMAWLWIGGAVLLAGTVVAIWPAAPGRLGAEAAVAAPRRTAA